MELKNTKPNNIALIVAGGTGQRFDRHLPKQFYTFQNKTILETTIECFFRHPRISKTFVVMHKDFIERFYKALQNKYNLPDAISGGKTRQQSVLNGLKAIQKCNPSHVFIHDAARPLISHSIITNLCNSLTTSDACYPALAITDTIRKIERQESQTIDRDLHYIVQTPQAFNFDKIFAAHQRFSNTEVTDDIAIAELATLNITKVDGCKRNIKITTKEDLEFAEFYFKNSNRSQKVA